MPLEVRTLRPDDQEAAFTLRQQTFGSRSEPFDRVRDTDWYTPLHRRLVAFDGTDLVAHAAAWDFGQHFGGVALPMAGISGVAVRPDARGRGAASLLVGRLLADAHEHGDVLSSLYPANSALYRRHGWEYGGTRTVRTVPSASLATLARPEERLDARPVRVGDPDDLDSVTAVHATAMARADGTLVRPRSYTARVASGLDGHESYLFERAGTVVGYVWTTRQSRPGGGLDLRVNELLGTDRQALLNAWRLVASWHPFIDDVQAVGSPADPLGWLLDSGPPELATQVEQWMLRLVDVPAALTRRGYPNAPSGRIALHVHDTSAAWNDGDWVVTFDEGRASVARGGDGTTRLDVGTLAALFSGWLPAQDAVRLDLVRGADETTVRLLRAAFGGPTPWMLSFF
ncbi:GNAT family N-acetyltransferase [Angustibacter sp. McL0619]|uniref:GNAT family N-acetyltransferase n=1 Tax=Angustibacter sp. McL0619 TaxID=3415676 RepID=UPI003CEC9CEF